MKRENGYYWVKIKADAATEGGLDILMGLLSPLGKWIIVEYVDGEWTYGPYDIPEHYFEKIEHDRILSPREQETEYWNEADYEEGLQ